MNGDKVQKSTKDVPTEPTCERARGERNPGGFGCDRLLLWLRLLLLLVLRFAHFVDRVLTGHEYELAKQTLRENKLFFIQDLFNWKYTKHILS